MASFYRKALVGGLTAVTLAGAVISSSAPAMAWSRGGDVAAGVIGGLAVGAIAGSAAANAGYGYGYAAPPPAPVYGGCYWVHRPVYDEYGNFAGRRPVRVCD